MKQQDANKQLFWKATIRKQRESSLSVNDWCTKYQVPISRFLVWEKRLSIDPSVTTGIIFKPVKLKEEKETVTMIINGNEITCDKDMIATIMQLLK